MASADLRRLHRLYEVDLAILELRKRAAALDTGQEIAAKIKALEKSLDSGEGAQAKKLVSEVRDLELATAGMRDKAKKLEAELYSGKIVNLREVEAYRQEIANLRKHADENEAKLLDLIEPADEARKLVARIEKRIEELKGQLVERQKSARVEQARLEAKYQACLKERPEAAKEVAAPLLAKYEAIRKQYETGMADIVDKKSCGACGNLLPEKAITALQEDRIVTCEQCHRILYYTEGLA
jgi:predicted  nucleic acid-binding Zn-ribbon protein